MAGQLLRARVQQEDELDIIRRYAKPFAYITAYTEPYPIHPGFYEIKVASE